MTNTKPYDVVLFGATSFVGKLVFEYYLRNYPSSTEFKWAVAARSEAKLSALKESLASEVDEAAASLPVIIADSMDQQSLDNMVAQAKVSNIIMKLESSEQRVPSLTADGSSTTVTISLMSKPLGM